MAALFWSAVLAGELVLGLLVADLAVRAHWRAVPVVLCAVGVPVAVVVAAQALCFVRAAVATGGEAPRRWRCRAWAFAGELAAFGCGWLAMIVEPLRREGAARSAATLTAAPRGPVLLLHGLGCNRAVFGRLRARLQQLGFGPTQALSLQPPCAEPAAHIASAVQALEALERQTGGAPVHVVGHSMGGVLARAVLRVVGPQRIASVVTVGSPHHGTVLARWLGCAGARQVRPESAWLAALNAEQEGRAPVPLACVYSLEDNIVAPAASAALRGARLYELRGIGHFALLRSRVALDAIAAALEPPRSRGARIS